MSLSHKIFKAKRFTQVIDGAASCSRARLQATVTIHERVGSDVNFKKEWKHEISPPQSISLRETDSGPKKHADAPWYAMQEPLLMFVKGTIKSLKE